MSPLRLTLAAALVAVACQSGPQATPDAKSAADQAAAVAQAAAEKLAAEKAAAEKAAAAKAEEAAVAVLAKLPAVDEAALDKTVQPCDDFYQYACGGWMKSTPIPADRASWGRGFSEIAQRNDDVIKQLLEDAGAGKPDAGNPFSAKMGDYYATCMDEAKAETASLAALKKELKAIDAIKDLKALAQATAHLHNAGVNAFFSFGSDQDAADATKVIGNADQGGMGLPDKDFYTGAPQKKILDAYTTLGEELFGLLGSKPAEAKKLAKTAIAVEARLAEKSLRRVERRDPKALYNRLDRKGLAEKAKSFAWDVYFEGVGVKDVQAINVAVPAFFEGFDGVVADHKKLGDLKTYLKLRLIVRSADALGQKFVETHFKFISQLTGAKVLLPRWKRCVAQTSNNLGEIVGRSFVGKMFGGGSKPIAVAMIAGIERAFEKNLDTLTWMDAETKAGSVKKLHTFVNKIGYPDRWIDYGPMAIGKRSNLENRWAAAAFENKRDLTKIDKPLDRLEWGMPPALVNAQYNPALNDITFPAGILQAPFFKETQHPAANFGGIGLVMAHEITHGFDDEGSQYDFEGNLKSWWTKASRDEYEKRTQCVVDQYDGYVAVDDEQGKMNLNGKLTLGENIADIGGVKLSYRAYLAARPGQGHTVGGGFTDDQAFFLSFAQTWCTNMRPQMARLQAKTNEHSTPQWRVNGAVSDSPEFAAAFKCAEGAKMAPKTRCVVW